MRSQRPFSPGVEIARVDRILRHGDMIRMGDVLLTAYRTPGHTRGATTWIAPSEAQECQNEGAQFRRAGGFE